VANNYNFDPTSFNTRMQPYSSYDPTRDTNVATGGNNPTTTELSPIAQAITNNPYQIDWSTLTTNLTKAINSYFSNFSSNLQTAAQSFPSAPAMNFNINNAAIANAQGGLGGFTALQSYLQGSPSYKKQQDILNQYNQAKQQYEQNKQQSQADSNQMRQYYQNIEQQYQNMDPKSVSEMIGLGELQPFLNSFGTVKNNYGYYDREGTYQGIGVSMPTSLDQLATNEIRDLQAETGSGSHMGPQIESGIRGEENAFSNATNSMNSFVDNTKSLFTNLGLSSDETSKYMQPITNAFNAYNNMYVNQLGTPTNPNWIPNPNDPHNHSDTTIQGGGS
jgi:hypothetical protein